MNKTFVVSILLVSLILLFSGCTQQATQEPQSKTCSSLGGYACTENEQCFGKTLDSSDAATCCNVVCSQKTQTENQAKSCSEQEGFICKSGEKCEGTTLNAKDTTACCSVQCAKIETQPKEKTLEEINLNKDDFPEGFAFNDVVSGYQKNALEYADGNSDRANELLAKGWQENFAVDFVKRSETQEILGTKVILEDYFISLSRYDKAKDYVTYFKDSIDEYKMDYSNTEGVTILSQTFGDNSLFVKSTESNQYTGLTTVNYVLRFTKNNIFVNLNAAGQSRQITDEKVIEYARKIESRIS